MYSFHKLHLPAREPAADTVDMNDQPLDVAVGAEERSRRRRRRSGPQWQKLIAEHAAGDATVEAFCKERGLTASSFHAWRRRFKRAASSEAGAGPTFRGDGAVSAEATNHDAATPTEKTMTAETSRSLRVFSTSVGSRPKLKRVHRLYPSSQLMGARRGGRAIRRATATPINAPNA